VTDDEHGGGITRAAQVCSQWVAAPTITGSSAPVAIAPAAPATLVQVSGASQTGVAGAALPLAFVVKVQDQFGNAVPGVAVSFAAPAGANILSPSPVTGADGTASATATLPSTPGNIDFTASIAGLVPLKLSATATPVPVVTPSAAAAAPHGGGCGSAGAGLELSGLLLGAGLVLRRRLARN